MKSLLLIIFACVVVTPSFADDIWTSYPSGGQNCSSLGCRTNSIGYRGYMQEGSAFDCVDSTNNRVQCIWGKALPPSNGGAYNIPNSTEGTSRSWAVIYHLMTQSGSNIGLPNINAIYSSLRAGWQNGPIAGATCTPVTGSKQCALPLNELSDPIYYVVTNGLSGMVSFNGKTYRAIQIGTPIVMQGRLYSTDGAYYTTIGESHLNNSVGSFPSLPETPEEPNVVCNFNTDGDINLGIVDSSSASGSYASTYLYTQCTDDATVTAKIQKSGGGDNLLQMGGLNLRVIFDNSSDTKTYSANISQSSQIIWGQVTSVGTLTPGDYSQSMVVYLNYE